MKTLIVGLNALIATASGQISDALNDQNCIIAYVINPDGYQSYKPGRLSAISAFEIGKAYLISAKEAVDVSAYFDQPASAQGSFTAYNKTAGDLTIAAYKSNGDLINSNVLPAGQTAQVVSSDLPAGVGYLLVSGQGTVKFTQLTSYAVNDNNYTVNPSFNISSGFSVGANYLQGGAIMNLIFETA